MNVVIDTSAWLQAAAGGVLIGLAAALLIVVNGRIAGISGFVAGLLSGDREERPWRAAFVLGLIAGATLLTLAFGLHPSDDLQTGWLGMAIAGLLVGYGTRLGAGCTSGHGICGIARFSPRSIVATLVFMGFGALTVYVIRHGFGAVA